MQDLFMRTCKDLQNRLPCDFTGIALQNNDGTKIQWLFVSGNRNEKHKHITVRFEKGIAGKVIASGNTMIIPSFPENILGKSTDYPIMLAEKLVSVAALPIKNAGVTKGVLLAGFRKRHSFTQAELDRMTVRAKELESLLPEYFAG